MDAILNVIQILLSVALVVVILLQAKGAGLGQMFGGGDAGPSITKTRRGLEKTLFNLTVGLSIAFFLNAIITVIIFG
ncbi:MAG: preprotein translocase subunit SecG [Anaerolineae bacterium]|nr:preprotein translocase subunit SecG [Anaerolineae bacterium]